MTQDEWREIFGRNLSDILEETGMSQNELSKITGLSKSRISDYVNGCSTPSVFAIINMAYALELDISEFIDFEETIEM